MAVAQRTVATPEYPDQVSGAVDRITDLLKGDYGMRSRMIGLLALQRDDEVLLKIAEHDAAAYEAILAIVAKTEGEYSQPLSVVVSGARLASVREICASTVTVDRPRKMPFRERLSRAMMSPITGLPILALVLYFGFYRLVGVFGAGTMVDFIEGTIFGEYVGPWLVGVFERMIPLEWLSGLFVGEYGILTLGLSYALAIVLPIVTLFFLVFSVIEDSGYLPRLAMLIDRVFKVIGLNGRAVIPLALGFGCDTMATIVTRTQETRRERILTTVLLALAIPCSAQLGVVMGILSYNPLSLAIWGASVAGVFLLVGFIGAKILPGESARFYMELPPLRVPKLSNVVLKTLARLKWYLVEVIPIFVAASVLLWLGELTGLFDIIINRIMVPVVKLIGLPGETAVAFFMGFFRRDFGAAGLYDLYNAGILRGIPLVVAAVTLTLFLPCIAQFAVMLKERGIKMAIGIAVFIFPFAFGFGYLLNLVLSLLKVRL